MSRFTLFIIVILICIPTDRCSASKSTDHEIVRFELPDELHVDMVWIRPGIFDMGYVTTERYEDIDEHPTNEVTISSGFYISAYEITQGQWFSVMGTQPWDITKVSDGIGSNFPVANITWYESQDFIERLNKHAGDNIYRLPTEAEWEYVAKAGTETVWSFGNEASIGARDRYTWWRGNTVKMGMNFAQAVGTSNPNQWGIYDMAGNVWEWCDDWYGIYPEGPQKDPVGASRTVSKVIRGGSFANTCFCDLRPANRGRLMPAEKSPFVGFRIVNSK